MPTTYTLISSNVLSSSQASVTFSSIPATYTDLVVRMSVKTDNSAAGDRLKLTFNGDTATNYSSTQLEGDGGSAFSTRQTSVAYAQIAFTDASGATANTFGNLEFYVPSYLTSANKPIGSFGVSEDNSTTAFMMAAAGLWRGTSAITSLNIAPRLGTNLLTGSSFYLYGISNA